MSHNCLVDGHVLNCLQILARMKRIKTIFILINVQGYINKLNKYNIFMTLYNISLIEIHSFDTISCLACAASFLSTLKKYGEIHLTSEIAISHYSGEQRWRSVFACLRRVRVQNPSLATVISEIWYLLLPFKATYKPFKTQPNTRYPPMYIYRQKLIWLCFIMRGRGYCTICRIIHVTGVIRICYVRAYRFLKSPLSFALRFFTQHTFSNARVYPELDLRAYWRSHCAIYTIELNM